MGLKLEFPFKAERTSFALTKEQLDNSVREILRAVLRRGLEDQKDDKR